jgi:hypothetical protein
MINMTQLLLLVLAVTACAQQTPADLPTALKGIAETRFLACAGPPMLEYAQSGQDRMSFVTNLKRGQAIVVASPSAFAPGSCSIDATFEQDRLVSSSFSGSLEMCNLVFSPCLGK